jgi:hypothetical protein
MVATYGKRPNIGKQVTVSTDHDFKDGQYGMIRDFKWRSDNTYPKDKMPTEQECITEFKKKFNENDKSEIVYIKLHREWEYYSGSDGHVIITVDECIFKGNGIVPLVALAIIAVIGLIIGAVVVFIILYPGIVYSLFGISPGQAQSYQLAQLPVMILTVLLLISIVGALIIFWPRISKWARQQGNRAQQYARQYI